MHKLAFLLLWLIDHSPRVVGLGSPSHLAHLPPFDVVNLRIVLPLQPTVVCSFGDGGGGRWRLVIRGGISVG